MPDDPETVETNETQDESRPEQQLEGGTYEIIRNRLIAQGETLRERIDTLNTRRKTTFGSLDWQLVGTERVTTANNCTPRDMVAIGDVFLFGYNVHLGLRSEIKLSDVFAVYSYQDHTFHEQSLDLINNEQFEADFKDLYRYYKKTRFAKFAVIGPNLFMAFRVGESVTDVKTFKWLLEKDRITYVGNRFDHEYRFPPQHDFEWIRTTRDMHRFGDHPHISIEDRVFVETVGGDLTLKIEDNTDSGEGIYAEPVDNKDQTLDDAEIYYACVGHLILLKIRPYQEDSFRYIVYAEKVRKAMRIDDIAHSCVLLPEDHGIIFSQGYYLQNGTYKKFDNALKDMLFEKRVASPNGEDFLYVFYNRDSGTYILLSYDLIEQDVETPVICNGFSQFENGEVIYFKDMGEPAKSHPIQIWQTPFCGIDYETPTQDDNYLFKIGNRDIVRCMAACNGILTLIRREDSYTNLYLDIVRQSTDVLDTYFWIGEEDACDLGSPLREIKSAAASAIDEFEKVTRMRKNARDRMREADEKTNETLNTIRLAKFESIVEFVDALGSLRTLRGELIALKDVRYIDLESVEKLETTVQERAEELAQRCVDFLLTDDALQPYHEKVEGIRSRIDGVTTVVEAKDLSGEIDTTGSELEMLIDIVSNLKIEDTNQRTAIIDNISAIYSILNQVRSVLRNKSQELASVEGTAEFASQMKLLNQAVINYMDVCDTPERCDEYLAKVMIQLEELEGRFADFDEFVVQLAEKREEIYNAFENRKLQLIEARNKKASALMRSAERILKGIRNRAESLETIAEINGYFASDLMIEKVRDVIAQLTDLGDSVKSDDVQSQLKTIQQDSVRQLKDRQDLYVSGEDVIKFGQHNFAVNTQALDLTVLKRDDEMCLHLTGTDFFETITDKDFLATESVWSQEIVSENADVYRAEYLAYTLFRNLTKADASPSAEAVARYTDEELAKFVQAYMGPRYAEGYVKGVHDHDGAILLRALLDMHASVGLLAYPARARSLARVAWTVFDNSESKKRIQARLRGLWAMSKTFGRRDPQEEALVTLRSILNSFITETGLFEETLIYAAAEYLFHALGQDQGHPVSATAAELYEAFQSRLQQKAAGRDLDTALNDIRSDPEASLTLLRDWVGAFLDEEDNADAREVRDEVVALLFCNDFDRKRVASVSLVQNLTGLVGSHKRIQEGTYRLNYNSFMLRLGRFTREDVPAFELYQETKKRVVDEAREDMRLEEFRPRVLTSFVRNRLLDKVYLPLVGDNLAKQIGEVGERKRTDLMGLLLLISPPGYGKTTLMEYIANRLGIIFMKINGPAIGHRVTSLDPVEAPNASAREELEKLNLSLEMGDNVMIYLDDIQHCNPEFLQKFISLCDAQRKIEGVYKGRTRTYDLRGKKVCVVMAGNPYTESGEMFRIPDMLANRADTYNLGDIIGGNAESFKLSYLENALTSNPVLSKLSARSQQDVYGIIRIAETGTREGVELEGNYSPEEVTEFVNVMTKLLRVRDVILTVNQEYIRSAAQADEYRTEPAFKLQGSYRNMNRIVEKVLPIMNDEEVEALLLDHYVNEAQTLTTGAEANLLKFKLLVGRQTEEEADRWNEIKKTYKRNQLFRGAGADDRMGQVLAQLSTFSEGLQAIERTLGLGLEQMRSVDARGVEEEDADEKTGRPVEAALSDATLERISEILSSIQQNTPAPTSPSGPTETRLAKESIEAVGKMLADVADHLPALQTETSRAAPALPDTTDPDARVVAPGPHGVPRVEVVNKVPRGMLHILRQQFKLIQTFLDPLLKQSTEHSKELDNLEKRLEGMTLAYENLIDQIESGNRKRARSRKSKNDE